MNRFWGTLQISGIYLLLCPLILFCLPFKKTKGTTTVHLENKHPLNSYTAKYRDLQKYMYLFLWKNDKKIPCVKFEKMSFLGQ